MVYLQARPRLLRASLVTRARMAPMPVSLMPLLPASPAHWGATIYFLANHLLLNVFCAMLASIALFWGLHRHPHVWPAMQAHLIPTWVNLQLQLVNPVH